MSHFGFLIADFRLVVALLAVAVLPVRADEIVLKDGQTVSGTILSTDGRSVVVRMILGGGQAEAPYPLERIERIRFIPPAEQKALLASTDPAVLPQVLAVWEARRPFAAIPGNDAGEWALQAVRLKLARGTKKAAEEAIPLCEAVAKGDVSPERRTEAARLRLSALAAMGKTEQALEEAERMEQATGADEAALAAARAQSRLAQADVAWRKLKDLEKEWPKWEQMPDKRAERSMLLNQALDACLYPAVFHPELRALAAEGLWKSVEIRAAAGMKDEARAAAAEIMDWFPEAPFRAQAEAWIAKHDKSRPAASSSKDPKP